MANESVFLEHAIDGAHGRIEILEDRLRAFHEIVKRVAETIPEEQAVISVIRRDAKSLLRRMPEDPTLTE